MEKYIWWEYGMLTLNIILCFFIDIDNLKSFIVK